MSLSYENQVALIGLALTVLSMGLPNFSQAMSVSSVKTLAWSLTHRRHDASRHHRNEKRQNVEWIEKVTDEQYKGR